MFRRLDEGNVKRQFQLDIDRHNAQYTPFYKLYAPSQANCPQLADNFIENLYIANIQRVVSIE